jgi:uncharacterized protein YqeY
MTLKDQLKADAITALKAGDAFRKNTLRLAISEIEKEEKGGKTAVEFTDAQVENTLRTAIKRRRETAETYRERGVPERAASEEAEAELLGAYLPKQLSDAELEAIAVAAVTEAGDGAPFGLVMKATVATVAGRADGKRVSAAVKAALV